MATPLVKIPFFKGGEDLKFNEIKVHCMQFRVELSLKKSNCDARFVPSNSLVLCSRADKSQPTLP